MRIPFTAAILGFSLCLLPAQAAPQFVNGLTLNGALLDKSGGTSVNNGRLGYFSDLYYDRAINQWWALSDRGPGGGTISYDTRLQRFSLDVNPATGAISNFAIQQTVIFRNGNQTFNGLLPSPAGNLGNSFDPEGLVVLPQSGNFLVSDEYGPSVYEFTRAGQFLRAFQVPDNLVPKVGNTTNYTAAPVPGNSSGILTSGREGNRGLEGLAVSPDGRYAYAMLQNGTVTDGNVASTSFSRGMYTRILKYDTSTGNVVAQYAYRLDGAGPAPAQGRGISAIVALDENRFMVLERNNRGVGVPDANLSSPDKKVYIIDISGASDVSAINLNTNTLPTSVNPVAKSGSSLADLAAANILNDLSLTALGGRSPEKWEGLAVGPQLNDGSYLLLAGTDNDYSVTQNGSNVQFDVYFNPSNSNASARVQCDLGTTANCRSISSNGNVNNSPTPDVGNLPAGFALIPGTLIAFKASPNDLGGYTPPATPVPGPLPLAGALAGLGWSRRLRQRLRRAVSRA
jgi:hypothetical protein